MKMNVTLVAGTILVGLILCSCESLPPGTPPDGVIIAPTQPAKIKSLGSVVNFMILYLRSQCPEIAGGDKPIRMKKVFEQSKAPVDDVADKLWQRMQQMHLIWPVSRDSVVKASYCLKSTIKETQTKGVYRWQVRLMSPDRKKVYWQKYLYFKDKQK